MIASLPMYDWPQLRTAHNAYWCGIKNALAHRGIPSPDILLENGEGLAVWGDSSLVFSQTCGLPFRKYLSEKVNLVGTPDLGVEGCPPGFYRSYFVVRADDKRSKLSEYAESIFAYNSEDSQSGFAAAKQHAGQHGFWFQNTLTTVGHKLSASAIAEGRVDIAAIDAVSWRFIDRYEAFSKTLRVLEATRPTPGLPYITSKKYDGDLLFEAVKDAIDNLPPEVRSALGLNGIVRISKADYMAV